VTLKGVALAALALTALSGCGQTGALYLPEDESATVITRPGPATTGAPATDAPAASDTSGAAPATPAAKPPAKRDPATPAP